VDTDAEADLGALAEEALDLQSTEGSVDRALEREQDGVNETYKVSFEAACDCSAALFAIHDSAEAITLLYPTPEQEERLTAGVLYNVAATPGSKANPEEGVATEILLLLVSREPMPIARPALRTWVAAPGAPERLGELQTFLERLRRTTYDSAVAYLRVVE
jgi:hypothetical protein